MPIASQSMSGSVHLIFGTCTSARAMASERSDRMPDKTAKGGTHNSFATARHPSNADKAFLRTGQQMAFKSRVHSKASSHAVNGKLVECITHHFLKFLKYICHGHLVLL